MITIEGTTAATIFIEPPGVTVVDVTPQAATVSVEVTPQRVDVTPPGEVAFTDAHRIKLEALYSREEIGEYADFLAMINNNLMTVG